MKEFDCNYNGKKVSIKFTHLSKMKMEDIGMQQEAIYGSVVSALAEIVQMKPNDQFVIIDKEAMSTTVCGVQQCDDLFMVSVITVVELSRTLVKEGQKVIAI